MKLKLKFPFRRWRALLDLFQGLKDVPSVIKWLLFVTFLSVFLLTGSLELISELVGAVVALNVA